MGEWIAEGYYDGLEWLVASRAGTLAEGAIGTYAGRSSIFRIFSMTKPIVSLAVMRQVELGRAQLFHPVSRYLPEYADLTVLGPDGVVRPAAEPMTLFHLLTHMSGLSYGFLSGRVAALYAETGIFVDGAIPLRDEVRRLARLPLTFEPGAHWQYSVSTDVLGAALEVIADAPLPAVLRETVLDPLGMGETRFHAVDQARLALNHGGRTAVADPYQLVAHGPSKTYPSDNDRFSRGGTGLFSTTADYRLLCAELLRIATGRSGIVSTATLNWMRANQVPAPVLPLRIDLPTRGLSPGLAGYGFGLGFRRAMGHGVGIPDSPSSFGWAGAAETWFTVDPQNDLYAIFMAQNMDWPGREPRFPGDALRGA